MQKIKTLFLRNMLCSSVLLYALLWSTAVLSAQSPIALRPAQLLDDTLLLQQHWQADAALDLTAYTPAEVQLQRWYNRELAHEFVLSQRSIPDQERYPNNNYQLPLHQRHIDNEDITPYTWKWVSLEVKESKGSLLTAKLRRPIWWLQATGAEKIGNTIQLDLPELEIKGTALVTAIWPSYVDTRVLDFPNIGNQCYRPITGWFQRQTSEVWSLAFANGDTIGTTPTHPFYSLDQQAYVSAGKLQIGERIQTTNGSTTLLRITAENASVQWVYNLEVWRDHNFYVGKEGELVHNICVKEFLELFGDKEWASGRKFKLYAGKKWDNFAQEVKEKFRDKFGRDYVCYDKFGFPDFMPFVLKIGNKPIIVDISQEVSVLTKKKGMQGDASDYTRAINALKSQGITITNPYTDSDGMNYTWHHHQDGKHMMLVPSDVNNISGPRNSPGNQGAPHAGGSWVVKNLGIGKLPNPWDVVAHYLTDDCK